MDLKRWLQVYIAAIGLAAVAVLAACFGAVLTGTYVHNLQPLPQLALFVALGWFASRQHVHFSETNAVVMGSIVQMATLLLFPLPLALLTIATSKGISELSLLHAGKRRSWRQIVVNSGGVTLACACGGGAFYVLNGNDFIWDPGVNALLGFPALLMLAAAYYTTNVLIIAGAMRLSSQDSFRSVFRSLTKETFFPEVSLILVGIVLAVIGHFSPFLSLFIVVPMALSMRAFESVAKLRRETIGAVLKMAESIDYRDTGTYEHSQRLATLTRRTALAMGLLPEHVDEIVLASRVHDLGKIGISNDILLKQSQLTAQERAIMEEHPSIGATILSSYSVFAPSVDIVRHHHERWDGQGYPDNLKGDEIPIGSRIIAVVDSFDAMTSDRPYRAGIPVDVAVSRLKDGMGAQFDPKVCAVFIQLLIEDGRYLPPRSAPTLHVVKRDTA